MLCRVLSNQQFINHINQHTDETFCLQVGVHKTPGHPSGLKPFDITECIRHLTRITYKGDGIVVRALISHQCVGRVCWWLMLCSKGFPLGSPVSSLCKNQYLHKFQFDQDGESMWKPAEADLASSLNIVIYLFNWHLGFWSISHQQQVELILSSCLFLDNHTWWITP